MIIYDISFIASYYKSIEHEKIDSAIQTLLNDVLDHINNDTLLNNIESDNDNKFKKKNKFRKYDSNNNSNNSNTNNTSNSNNNSNNSNSFNVSKDNFILSRTIKNTYISTKKKSTQDKSKFDAIKSNIKIILNKLSPANYSKLETEFLNIYNELIEEDNSEENIIIDNYIIEHICYNNLSYSTIYVNILFTLIANYYAKDYKIENIYIYNLLKEKYNELLKIEHTIKNNTEDDEYTINKNNDKYKCFIIFIINFNKKIYYYELENIEKNAYVKQLFINCYIIEEFVTLFNNFFINNLKIEKNNSYCEIILEFVIIVYNELFKEPIIMKKIDHSLNLYNTIKTLVSNECGYANFTNKIKFKLMDIEDKYKKYIL
jgi:hypothetical protein